ncbi:MAG: hypothetical protein WBN86_06400, partial [Porticoccaceae bacterium]
MYRYLYVIILDFCHTTLIFFITSLRTTRNGSPGQIEIVRYSVFQRKTIFFRRNSTVNETIDRMHGSYPFWHSAGNPENQAITLETQEHKRMSSEPIANKRKRLLVTAHEY